MELTILTCNHDTPDITRKMIKSFVLTNINISPDFLVMDTSYYNGQLDSFVETIASIVDVPDTSHGNAVNLAFDYINSKYILLVDSDVLFLKDITKTFEKFKESGAVLMGEVVGDRGGKKLHPRVNPWFCFMDLETLKNHNIKFYDHHRTKEIKSDRIYDIGSTMFEDVVNAGLTIADVKMEGKYFKHYEGMSWRVQKYNPNQPDTDIDVGGTHPNKALYEYGLMIQKQYEEDTKNL